jgi:hypothetical protein
VHAYLDQDAEMEPEEELPPCPGLVAPSSEMSINDGMLEEDAKGLEDATKKFGPGPSKWPEDAYYCGVCDMWVRDWDKEHIRGKKHIKKLCGRGSTQQQSASKGVAIPMGTALLIEQTALLNDAKICWAVRCATYAVIVSRL